MLHFRQTPMAPSNSTQQYASRQPNTDALRTGSSVRCYTHTFAEHELTCNTLIDPLHTLTPSPIPPSPPRSSSRGSNQGRRTGSSTSSSWRAL